MNQQPTRFELDHSNHVDLKAEAILEYWSVLLRVTKTIERFGSDVPFKDVSMFTMTEIRGLIVKFSRFQLSIPETYVGLDVISTRKLIAFLEKCLFATNLLPDDLPTDYRKGDYNYLVEHFYVIDPILRQIATLVQS